MDIDSYSAFFDNMKLSHTALQEELQKRNVTDVYVCGLAYDICVGEWKRVEFARQMRSVLGELPRQHKKTSEIQISGFDN